jgi:hypothetical protein
MPQALLFDTLRVSLEVVHQVFDLLELGVGIGMQDLGQVFHQAEIGTHGVSQAGQLTELRDESHLITCASVLVDQQRLVHVADAFVVASTIVLLVAGGSPVLVESGCWTLRKVDPINFVGLLVVARDHRRASECFLNRLLAILSTLLGLVSQIIHVVQAVVCPDHFEADVNVEQDA